MKRFVQRLKNRGRQTPGILELEGVDLSRGALGISAAEVLAFAATGDRVACLTALGNAAVSLYALLSVNRASTELIDEGAYEIPVEGSTEDVSRAHRVFDTGMHIVQAGFLTSLTHFAVIDVQMIANAVRGVETHLPTVPMAVNGAFAGVGMVALYAESRFFDSTPKQAEVALTETPETDTITEQ